MELAMEYCLILGGCRRHKDSPPLKMDGLFHGESGIEMDDDWGYPLFRTPPDVGPG